MKKLLFLLLFGQAFAQGTYITDLPNTTPVGPEFIAIAQQAAACGTIPTYNGYCGAYVTPAQLKTYIGAGVGTITSVTITPPTTLFTVGTGTCTGPACTFAFSLATATANYVWAGPTSGSAATPTYRALVAADIPNGAYNTTGTSGGISGNQTANFIYAGPSSGSAAAATWRAMVAADLALFSGLSSGSALAGGECVPMTQSGADYCTTPSAISTFVLSNISTVAYTGLNAGTAIDGPDDLIANYSADDTALEKVSPNAFKWRGTSVSTATSIALNVDLYDVEWMNMTGTGGTFTISNPTGTPIGGQTIVFLLQSTNAQTMAYGANVTQGGCLSTSSGSSKSDWFKLKYNPLSSKWNCSDDGHNY